MICESVVSCTAEGRPTPAAGAEDHQDGASARTPSSPSGSRLGDPDAALCCQVGSSADRTSQAVTVLSGHSLHIT